MESKEDYTFSTRDLYLAATLVTLRFLMLRIDIQIEGNKSKAIGYFNFEDTQELRDARIKYNQGMIEVEPRMFVNNMQSLKSEVVNLQQNPMSSFNR